MQTINKHIERSLSTSKLFDERTLEKDYAPLIDLLRPGMIVLDVGCGTGAISKDVAKIIGPQGRVIGIDNTAHFIDSGKKTYAHVKNLELINVDLFDYQFEVKFDLIVSARTLQWLSNPKEAIAKMKDMLKPYGWLSVLDYDHSDIEWIPEPPASMRKFYTTFLRWRADAGMNNNIAVDAKEYFAEAGFKNINVNNADEVHVEGQPDFGHKTAIWSKVAGLSQIEDEGYISNADRLLAIKDYEDWILTDAKRMVLKLNEIRGQNIN